MIGCVAMIDKNEVLRYLGYRGQDIDDNMEALINICREEVVKKSNPRYIYRYFDLNNSDDGIELKDTILLLEGNDIKKHLKGCHKCAILVVTLGLNIEREINKNEKINLTKSLILDACATTYIEEICDSVQNEIEDDVKKNKFNITSRFSPGYGDLTLSIQKDILNVMNSSSTVGVTATSHNILLPRKSVTAIIGISSEKQKSLKRECSHCNKYESCNFRMGGKNCGN